MVIYNIINPLNLHMQEELNSSPLKGNKQLYAINHTHDLVKKTL